MAATSIPAPIVIVGAGLAGLASARAFVSSGRTVDVLEAGDAVGGRVRTDVMDGFRLDRGFQVLFTAYPETSQVLDVEVLKPHPYRSGALVCAGGTFHRLIDPFRSPVEALAGVIAPVGTLTDKIRVLGLTAARGRRRSTTSSTPPSARRETSSPPSGSPTTSSTRSPSRSSAGSGRVAAHDEPHDVLCVQNVVGE